MSEMRLLDVEGHRLYLTAEERTAFLKAARTQDPIHCAFAEMLFFTGCRISEALALTTERIDLSDHQVIFRSLKKRRQDVYRAVPLPPEYIDSLQRTFSLRQAQKHQKKKTQRLWPWDRVHAWRVIKQIMLAADIPEGPHQTAKGLRHAYGIHAISKGIPVTSVKKWLGHAQLSMTEIYVDFVGAEASDLAA